MKSRRLVSGVMVSVGLVWVTMLNGAESRAEAIWDESELAAEAGLMTSTDGVLHPIDLERIQYGIDVVRETATAEELPALDALQAQVDLARSGESPDRQSQTWIGRVASKAGIGINRAVMAVYRPFVYATAYLIGRYEKPKRLDTQSDNPFRNALGRIVNRLRDLGESVAAEIGDRALRGEPLSRAEIELLVGKFPALEPRDWEFVGSLGGMAVGIGVTAKVLRAAGIANLGPVILAGEVAYLSAVAPCFINDLSKHPSTNPNFLGYCDQLMNDTYTLKMTSRIRGYLRGVKDRSRPR